MAVFPLVVTINSLVAFAAYIFGGLSCAYLFAQLYFSMKETWRRARMQRRLYEHRHGVVYLFAFPRSPNSLQHSIPCLAVETFLRMADIPYEFVPILDANESPTGRLPFIELNGQQLADSVFIIEHLCSVFADKVRANLAVLSSHKEAAIATMMLRLTQYPLRFAYARRYVVDNFDLVVQHYKLAFPSFVPEWVRRIVLSVSLRNKAIALLNQDGFGDLTDVQYRAELERDLLALAAIIGPFSEFGGFALTMDKPVAVDAHIFAALYQMRSIPVPDYDLLRDSTSPLGSYIAHMIEAFFPDEEKLIAKKKRRTAFVQEDHTSPPDLLTTY